MLNWSNAFVGLHVICLHDMYTERHILYIDATLLS